MYSTAVPPQPARSCETSGLGSCRRGPLPPRDPDRPSGILPPRRRVKSTVGVLPPSRGHTLTLPRNGARRRSGGGQRGSMSPTRQPGWTVGLLRAVVVETHDRVVPPTPSQPAARGHRSPLPCPRPSSKAAPRKWACVSPFGGKPQTTEQQVTTRSQHPDRSERSREGERAVAALPSRGPG